MRITEKHRIIEELKSKFAESDSVILTNYKGLNVDSMNLLRRALREAGVEFRVVKNSLLTRASAGFSVELIKDKFAGPNAIALCSGNPVTLAKVLVNFSSENNALEVKTGVLGNRVIDANEIKTLASLPSRNELFALLLFSMNAVPTSLVTVLSGVARNLVNVLQALRDQRVS